MKHVIVIDDQSKAGKNLLELAEILSENDQSIFLVTEEEEDKALLEKMLSSQDSDVLSSGEKAKFLNQLREQANL